MLIYCGKCKAVIKVYTKSSVSCPMCGAGKAIEREDYHVRFCFREEYSSCIENKLRDWSASKLAKFFLIEECTASELLEVRKLFFNKET